LAGDGGLAAAEAVEEGLGLGGGTTSSLVEENLTGGDVVHWMSTPGNILGTV
jgi:hypothetical protein